MKKLFVLNGGAVVKPGLTGAMLNIANPEEYFQKSGINTGDVLVYDAMLKQLSYDQVLNLQFSHAGDESRWPSDDVDATVIRGSNYLTANLDLSNIIPLLKKLRGPIVPVGVGAQASSYTKLKLPAGSVEAWRIIASKCQTIGVRGFYSAEVFNDIGIKNVRVIGCPSFYRSLQPSITIRNLSSETARVGITLNKYLAADYASSTLKTNRMQRSLLQAVAERPGSQLYSQGEREESLAVFSDEPLKTELINKVTKAFALDDSEAVIELMRNRMVALFDVDKWADSVGSNIDCMMGFRLHGNVIALHQGIPAIFFTYDSRIRELSSLFHVPSVDIDDFRPIDLNQLMANANFQLFEAAYRTNYAEYRRFLNENGLLNRLPPPVSEQLQEPAAQVNSIHQNFTGDQIQGWMRQEVDYMAKLNDELRSRSWKFELKIRDLQKQLQDRS